MDYTNFLIEKTLLIPATVKSKVTVFVCNFDLKSSLLLKLKAFMGFITKKKKKREESTFPPPRVNNAYSIKFKLQNASE